MRVALLVITTLAILFLATGVGLAFGHPIGWGVAGGGLLALGLSVDDGGA